MSPDLMTPAQVAERWGVSTWTVAAMNEAGDQAADALRAALDVSEVTSK